MSKFKRIIVAGPLVVEAVYPAPHPRDGRTVRQDKKALSSQAQQLMNLKYAYQKLELLIAANFGKKDIYATLTYDNAHLPENRQEAKKKVSAFVKRLRKAGEAQGQEFRYIYNTEHKHRHDEGSCRDPAQRSRWEEEEGMERAESSPKAGTEQSGISSGEDYDLIRRLWGQDKAQTAAEEIAFY